MKLYHIRSQPDKIAECRYIIGLKDNTVLTHTSGLFVAVYLKDPSCQSGIGKGGHYKICAFIDRVVITDDIFYFTDDNDEWHWLPVKQLERNVHECEFTSGICDKINLFGGAWGGINDETHFFGDYENLKDEIERFNQKPAFQMVTVEDTSAIAEILC